MNKPIDYNWKVSEASTTDSRKKHRCGKGQRCRELHQGLRCDKPTEDSEAWVAVLHVLNEIVTLRIYNFPTSPNDSARTCKYQKTINMKNTIVI